MNVSAALKNLQPWDEITVASGITGTFVDFSDYRHNPFEIILRVVFVPNVVSVITVARDGTNTTDPLFSVVDIKHNNRSDPHHYAIKPSQHKKWYERLF